MKKTAMVTGGARGIGLAIVKQLIEDGYAVSIMDLAPIEKVQETLCELNNTGEVLYTVGDLSRQEDRNNYVIATVAWAGRIDALVNNAGVAPRVRADLLEMSEESFDWVNSINLKGTMFMTQAVANQMILQDVNPETGRRGKIVNISSMSAYTTSVNRGEYCVSKAGISMLTMLYADRLSSEGIQVFEVRPGVIATDMTSTVTAKYDKMIADGIFPIARWGYPKDIANAVSVLCSDKLSYSTGEIINVDGGYHLRRM